MAGRIRKIFRLTPFSLSIMLIGALVAVYLLSPRFLDIVELKAGDLRFAIRGPIHPGPEVAIAAIDEKSVSEIGRWPWPRARIAELTRALSADGARVIAFDVGFFEPEINNNLALVQRLEDEVKRLELANDDLDKLLDKERRLADNDEIFARALKESETPVVLGFFFHMARDESISHITPEQIQARVDYMSKSHYSFVRLAGSGVNPAVPNIITGVFPDVNISILHDAAQASGFFNMLQDMDGAVRWVPVTIRCQDRFFMPLSLQAIRFFLGDVPSSLTVSEAGVEKASVGNYNLPADNTGRLLINYRGPSRTFPYYSIADILNGSTPKGTFKDRIVLIGATSVGIYDLRVTPFDSAFPGIEIHANVIDNILRQDFLKQPDWAAILDMASIVAIGLLLGLVLPSLSALAGFLVGVGLTLSWSAANYYFFTRGLWINIVYPLLTILTMYTAITVHRYMTEELEKKKIRGAFSYYVNPSVVSEMLKNPDMLKLGGEKRIMTVLFSDIRGFTSISERMDPEHLVALLNRYLTAMSRLVFKFDGLVDKYIGDALMAMWGAPLQQPDHAVLACRTALEMTAELRRVREEWASEDPAMPFIDIGIGINSGPMVVGNMGSELRFDYTVMGDSVNLGSRLEAANKQYGTNILIGETTYELVKDYFYCREMDAVAVRGKTMPVRIYELLGEPGQIPEERLKMARAFTMGLKAYQAHRWDEAFRVFSAIHDDYPHDRPTVVYLERIEELKNNPPPEGWDGVFVMKTK